MVVLFSFLVTAVIPRIIGHRPLRGDKAHSLHQPVTWHCEVWVICTSSTAPAATAAINWLAASSDPVWRQASKYEAFTLHGGASTNLNAATTAK